MTSLPPPAPHPSDSCTPKPEKASGNEGSRVVDNNGPVVVDSRGSGRDACCGRCSQRSGDTRLPGNSRRRRHRAKENGGTCQACWATDRARAHHGREAYPQAPGHGVRRIRVCVDDASVQGGRRGTDCECPLLQGVWFKRCDAAFI